MAQGAARASRPTASVGFVTGAQAANTVGLAGGRHHVLAEAGWDVERRRADRRAAGPGGRRRRAARHHRPVAAAARASASDVRRAGRAPTRNGAIDVDDLARVLAAGPAGPTIVCLQAGNVNTGACDDLRAALRARRTGTAAGCTSTARSGCGPRRARPPRHLVDGRRAGRLVGLRRAQVAQRALRLRVRVLRATRRARRGDVVHRVVPGRARAASPLALATSLPSPRGGPAASPSGRRCASWAATASPSWSTAAARWPAGSPTVWPRRRRGGQRRGAQPGAGRVRRRRRAPTR